MARLKDCIFQADNIADIDHLLRQSSLQRVMSTGRLVPEKLFERNRSVLFLLFSHLPDFYYIYHLVRSTAQSEEESSKLLETDSTVLQTLADFLVRQLNLD